MVKSFPFQGVRYCMKTMRCLHRHNIPRGHAWLVAKSTLWIMLDIGYVLQIIPSSFSIYVYTSELRCWVPILQLKSQPFLWKLSLCWYSVVLNRSFAFLRLSSNAYKLSLVDVLISCGVDSPLNQIAQYKTLDLLLFLPHELGMRHLDTPHEHRTNI